MRNPMRKARRKVTQRGSPGSSHPIDDPLWDDDDLLRSLAVERAADRIEGEHSRFNIDVAGITRNGYVRPFLAVDLDWKRNGAFEQQLAFDHGPALLREQAAVAAVAERRPAFLSEMGHHGLEQLHENFGRFVDG